MNSPAICAATSSRCAISENAIVRSPSTRVVSKCDSEQARAEEAKTGNGYSEETVRIGTLRLDTLELIAYGTRVHDRTPASNETPRQVQLDSLRRLAESGRVSATRTQTDEYQN